MTILKYICGSMLHTFILQFILNSLNFNVVQNATQNYNSNSENKNIQTYRNININFSRLIIVKFINNQVI